MAFLMKDIVDRAQGNYPTLAPVVKHRKNTKLYNYRGQRLVCRELAALAGVSTNTMQKYLDSGKTPEEAVNYRK